VKAFYVTAIDVDVMIVKMGF
jgi:hypothetical protein